MREQEDCLYAIGTAVYFDVSTSAVLAHEFTPTIHCRLFFTVKQNMTTLLFSLSFKYNLILNCVDIYICIYFYTQLKIK